MLTFGFAKYLFIICWQMYVYLIADLAPKTSHSGWAVFALAHQFLFNIICWLWNAMEIHPVKVYFMTFL